MIQTTALCGIYPEKLAKKAKMYLKKLKKKKTERISIDNKILHYIVNFHGFKSRFVDLRRCQSQES